MMKLSYLKQEAFKSDLEYIDSNVQRIYKECGVNYDKARDVLRISWLKSTHALKA